MNEIVAYFYAEEDNYNRMHQVSYLPNLTEDEIADDLFHCWGKVVIVGYEKF